jgi:hypothetical protein
MLPFLPYCFAKDFINYCGECQAREAWARTKSPFPFFASGNLRSAIGPHPSSDERPVSACAQEFINYCYECQPETTEHGRLVNPVITPRFIPTCTPELLKVRGQRRAASHSDEKSQMRRGRGRVGRGVAWAAGQPRHHSALYSHLHARAPQGVSFPWGGRGGE